MIEVFVLVKYTGTALLELENIRSVENMIKDKLIEEINSVKEKLTRESIPNVIIGVTIAGIAFETALYLCNLPVTLALVTLIPVALLVKQYRELPEPCMLKVADEGDDFDFVTCDY